MNTRLAKYALGQVVRHKMMPFRGVVFDVDPEFANGDEWWLAIPEDVRPDRDQPFYHLLAESEQGPYVAYVSEQNLTPDDTGQPVENPDAETLFAGFDHGHYLMKKRLFN